MRPTQSAKALYIIVSSVHNRTWIYRVMKRSAQSYDYTLEKVKMYTRVPLGDIIGITKGLFSLILRSRI